MADVEAAVGHRHALGDGVDAMGRGDDGGAVPGGEAAGDDTARLEQLARRDNIDIADPRHQRQHLALAAERAPRLGPDSNRGGGAGALRDARDRRALHRQVRAAAASMIQLVSTPPPSPPSAAMSRLTGRVAPLMPLSPRRRARRWSGGAARAARGPSGWGFGWSRAIEGRAQHRRMRHLAAQAAADAARDHARHGIGAQRVGVGLMVRDGQPESRMQEWSPVQISSSTP